MLSLWPLLLSLAYLAHSVLARSSTGDSVLVVLDPGLKRANFSTFFDGLEERGFELTFRAPKDVQPAVIADDHPNFSHVILFAPDSKNFASDITPQSLVDLLSKNTNLLIAVGTKQTPLTSLAAEFSLILPPPGTPLISHFPERDTPATVIPVNVPASHAVLSPNIPPVWFSGVPFAFGSNPHIVPILNAPVESFAADSDSDSGADALVDASEKGGEGLWAGSSLGLVAGFQTLGGGRATWVGSVDLFNDEFFKRELPGGVHPGNAQFAADIAAWTFQETNMLRIDSVTHHRVNETESASQYTINNHVTYTMHISKFNPQTSTWEPYSGINDMQLEFTMLDPHIRTILPPVAGEAGNYSVTFRVPDRHGVFKFVVDYKRRGWSYLQSTTVVPVVPPRHDEYPRFLSPAWPYYAGAISTSVAFVLFCALWLAGDSVEPQPGKKAKSSKSE
ncbi:dolichyl-diphosphooligosaccharide-protein glycosyltransferase [Laetiporus sulphureus 93-53]|uniref:Dolichyl-diphosphooligosaccharide--protein glycosyltransferase subunit WBP1 n=1 Tax=Laetiporus sulphureus 93-53 TaxID=1314785 RepID=A0A165H153_9APHY|nr:dolichyl-diphosphooligosaccharide-protein glycosyltransferase [Laetiporus sulphureus 93-53]KZT11101.1 dolichyl-diphosphooligosaccharide-protein glycosyltransferase [Laetiporus sulphureus 93-53]